jgi:hypothetical protein
MITDDTAAMYFLFSCAALAILALVIVRLE